MQNTLILSEIKDEDSLTLAIKLRNAFKESIMLIGGVDNADSFAATLASITDEDRSKSNFNDCLLNAMFYSLLDLGCVFGLKPSDVSYMLDTLITRNAEDADKCN